MFLVIDLMMGGDLRFHLNEKGTLPEDMITLIAAEVGCGLDYLHREHIVHRDLKPDNILLDVDGHACITDFNIATRFKSDKPMTTIAGSPVYMGKVY